MSIAHYAASFLAAIAVLVAVHELGHYWAARICKVKILRFSLGFGPQLLMRKWGIDQTEWSLAAIPLGGYVKMLDEREAAVPAAELHRAFNTQSLAKRSFIVVAGPLANLILAVLIYWILACIGSRDFAAVLGQISPSSVAAKAGFLEKDRVVAIGGAPISSWGDLRWQVIQRALDTEPVSFTLVRGDDELSLRLNIGGIQIDEKAADPLQQLGISLPQFLAPPVLAAPLKASPADTAGFKSGDRVRTVDGQKTSSWQDFVKLVSAAPGRKLLVEVERDGLVLEISVVPESVAGSDPLRGRIGVANQPDEDFLAQNTVDIRYGFFGGAVQGVKQTWSTASFSLRVMWNMLTGKVSFRNVSGPVTIADYAGQSASAGWSAYLRFLAMVSISLGVLNLLPIPILDGGHLLYYVIECIRGRPLSEGAEETFQRIGLTALALLMSLAFFNDLNRVIFG